jgi:hypothetical protein
MLIITQDDLLEVIVRFHDPGRIDELGAALLCLVGQTYRPLRVMVVTQRFGADALAALKARLDIYRRIDPSVTLDVIPFTRQSGLADARSALINAGLAAGRGRYVAFLDYDDTLYPHAYDLLTGELRASGCAVAFGGIALKSLAVDPAIRLGLAFARRPRAAGSSLVDQFRQSFCPLHSMMLDRTRIAPAALRTDEDLPIYEDYEWLLRLGARYRFSFARLSEIIGDYRFKDDGSNTVLLAGNETAERRRLWKHYEALIQRRKGTLTIEVKIQESIGLLPPCPGLTVGELLAGLDDGSLQLRSPDYLAPKVVALPTNHAAY